LGLATFCKPIKALNLKHVALLNLKEMDGGKDRTFKDEVENWGVDEVATFIDDLLFSKKVPEDTASYIAKQFFTQEVTGYSFLRLKEKDLAAMIMLVGPRIIIADTLSQINADQQNVQIEYIGEY
jgi:hypothetical protein